MHFCKVIIYGLGSPVTLLSVQQQMRLLVFDLIVQMLKTHRFVTGEKLVSLLMLVKTDGVSVDQHTSVNISFPEHLKKVGQ
jgi:hypothetical protein